MPLFRGSSTCESLILSHHSRFTRNCNKEEIDDDDHGGELTRLLPRQLRRTADEMLAMHSRNVAAIEVRLHQCWAHTHACWTRLRQFVGHSRFSNSTSVGHTPTRVGHSCIGTSMSVGHTPHSPRPRSARVRCWRCTRATSLPSRYVHTRHPKLVYI